MSIVVVDDSPEVAREALVGATELISLHPQQLRREHLIGADVVLVDHVLDAWDERVTLPLACQPQDGLALAAVIRSHLWPMRRPTAIALFSGELNRLSPGAVAPEHVIARTYGLEWAFAKRPADRSISLVQRIQSLADAVRALPTEWRQEAAEQQIADDVLSLLKVPDDEWRAVAWEDIEKCHPPLHELYKWTDGLAFLRWFAHRILPYPCFLVDVHHLAVRLSVSVEWLHQQLATGKLREALSRYEYSGVLADFMSTRWWSAGVDGFIWQGTRSSGRSRQAVHQLLGQIVEQDPPISQFSVPVVTIDDQHRSMGVSDASRCVRLQPDDWPPYARQAWADVAVVRDNAALAAIVVEADRDKLDEA